MKHLICLILTICSVVNVYGQNLDSYNRSCNGMRDWKGMEIEFLTVPDKEDLFYSENPDTIWIKKHKKPKKDKHYKLIYTYRATLNRHLNCYQTPRTFIEGRKFLVKDVVYNHMEVDKNRPNCTRSNLYTLTLCDINNKETIYMKVEIYKNVGIEIKVRNRLSYKANQLKEKTFVNNKTGLEFIVKDFYYHYRPGQSFHEIKNLSFEFENRLLIEDKNEFKDYISLKEYNKRKDEEKAKQLEEKAKQLEEKAQIGCYVINLSSVEEPSSIQKGKITEMRKYANNHFELSFLQVPDKYGKYYRVFILNKYQGTIVIDWRKAYLIEPIGEDFRYSSLINFGKDYDYICKKIDDFDLGVRELSSLAESQELTMIPSKEHINYQLASILDIVLQRYKNLNKLGYYRENSQIKLIIPIKIGSRSYEYTFIYDVNWKWSYPEIRKEWLELKEKLKN